MDKPKPKPPSDGQTSVSPPTDGLPTARAITGYHLDDIGDWVAELACGHNQHVRHRPPFQLREWVLEAAGRAERLGTLLPCTLCDRAELPETLRLARTTAVWDEHTMPVGLRRSHRVAAGTWGRLTVHAGSLRFHAATRPPIDLEVHSGSMQPIPPDIEHDVQPIGAVQFSIEFLAVTREHPDTATAQAEPGESTEGGDPASWGPQTCPECGAISTDGSHRPKCSSRRR